MFEVNILSTVILEIVCGEMLLLRNLSFFCFCFCFYVLIRCDSLWPPSQSPATCTVPTWVFPYPYRNMAGAPFPIMLCLHLTHQTVAVPAARAPAQITTRQLIELFFSSQAGGHCKNIPTLEYGFLVQVRAQKDVSPLTKPLLHFVSVIAKKKVN